jgi:hypothetical protein
MMAASFGKNMRITISDGHRALARRLFTEVLGCTLKTPKDDLDVFVFADGFSLGAYVVSEREALGPAQHMKGPWLELFVDDPARTKGRLVELGIAPFDYVDTAHAYFCPPCGPVFRLAQRT